MSTWNNVTYQHSHNTPENLPNPYSNHDTRSFYWEEGVEWAIDTIRHGNLVVDGIDFTKLIKD